MSTGPQTTPGLYSPSQELGSPRTPACPGLERAARPLQPLGAEHLFALRRRRLLIHPQGPSLFALETVGGGCLESSGSSFTLRPSGGAGRWGQGGHVGASDLTSPHPAPGLLPQRRPWQGGKPSHKGLNQ